ncbi:sulfotransferase [Sergentomyia squamirostris]
MPIVCENILSGELTKKAEYTGISDFMRMKHTRKPTISISEKWNLRPYFMPSKYRTIVPRVDNFVVREDDVWVVTFPKCGTTWTQEMVWLICNDLNYEQAKAVELNERFPYLELGGIMPDKFALDFFPMVDKMPSPRLIKSHLPAPFLPKDIWTVKPKIVYTARNAKDTAVSFYHHYRNLQGYRGSFSDFVDAFLNDAVIYAPYDSHIFDFWNMREEENILFLTYEDMKKDHPSVIRKTAEFFGKSYTDEEIETLADHLTFDKMSKNESVNLINGMDNIQKMNNIRKKDESYNFIRKGKVGSYRDEMTPELIERFDTWIQERMDKYHLDREIKEIFLPSM